MRRRARARAATRGCVGLTRWTTELPTTAAAVAIDDAGRIVVGGESVHRWTQDGQRDLTFDAPGISATAIAAGTGGNSYLVGTIDDAPILMSLDNLGALRWGLEVSDNPQWSDIVYALGDGSGVDGFAETFVQLNGDDVVFVSSGAGLLVRTTSLGVVRWQSPLGS